MHTSSLAIRSLLLVADCTGGGKEKYKVWSTAKPVPLSLLITMLVRPIFHAIDGLWHDGAKKKESPFDIHILPISMEECFQQVYLQFQPLP